MGQISPNVKLSFAYCMLNFPKILGRKTGFKPIRCKIKYPLVYVVVNKSFEFQTNSVPRHTMETFLCFTINVNVVFKAEKNNIPSPRSYSVSGMNPDLANLNFRSHERVVILNQDKRGFLQWNDRP